MSQQASRFTLQDALFPLVLAALTLLAHANSLQGVFTLDDFINIFNNRGITGCTPDLQGIVDAAASGPSHTRWLPNLSFALDYALYGEEARGYHLTNLLIHLLCALVFYRLSLATLRTPALRGKYPAARETALAAALLWAVHPLQTNGVVYIVQRMTSMAALFFISSLLCYARARMTTAAGWRRRVLYGASLVLGFMAVISKENSYMLPVMVVLFELFFITDPDNAREWKKTVLWFGTAATLILFTTLLLLGPDILAHITNAYRFRDFSMGERLLTESRVFFLYLSLLVLPLPSRLNLNHDITLSTGLFTPPQTTLALLGLAAYTWLIFRLYRRNRLLSFSLAWFIGNLLLESTVVPLELIFEHRLYLPSTFLVLGVTAAVVRFCKNKPWPARSGAVILVCLFSFWTWQRNQVWGSNITLWSDVAAKSPNLARAHNNLGVALHDSGQDREAELEIRKAISLAPDDRLGYQSLGSLYISENRLQEAEQVLKAGLARQTRFNPARLYHYLGIVARKSGRYREAIQYASLALSLNDADLSPMLTLGIAYTKTGRPEKADALFREMELKGEKSVDLYNNWGIAVFNMGGTRQAIGLFKRALAIDPDHPESHNNLGLAYGALGMTDKARQEMMRAMRLKQTGEQ